MRKNTKSKSNTHEEMQNVTKHHHIGKHKRKYKCIFVCVSFYQLYYFKKSYKRRTIHIFDT
jgi:hypothetical protein